jgi:outer membrane protein assembly factor BamB
VPPGHSSPIVWDDHIFLTAVEDDALVVLALRRRDGELRWRRTVEVDAIEKVHRFSSPAASTAATDGQRVYVYFGSFGLVAYNFDGQEVWRKPLAPPPTQYGSATSPIVFDGKLILQRDGNSTESELLALDARTGAVAWRSARPMLKESFSTPIVWRHDGQDEIITSASNRVVASSATTGEERWWVAGLTAAPITVPVIGDGLLYAGAVFAGSPSDPIIFPTWDELIAKYDTDKDARLALSEAPASEGVIIRKEVPKEAPGNFVTVPMMVRYTDGDGDGVATQEEWNATLAFLKDNEDNVVAIRPGGSGDSTKTHLAWTASLGIPEMPSPLFYRGRLYLVRDGGFVTSYAPATGDVVLRKQRLGAFGQYIASPVAADGRIYAANLNGIVVVFRAGDTLEVLARNDLGEDTTATPAIADDKLYIRTASHLWAFGE